MKMATSNGINSGSQVIAFGKNRNNNIKPSPRIAEFARADVNEVLKSLRSSPSGLSQAEIEERQETYGLNEMPGEVKHGWLWFLWIALRNPLVILLSVLATISFIMGDVRAGTVMSIMVTTGVLLRLIQEVRADSAAEKLKAMIKVTATVIRDGSAREVPLKELVPGDIVKLSAGDMIPADIRIIASKDLFINQATMTGESIPVEKSDARETRDNISPFEFCNICFLGTSVESGSATGVVVTTGAQTYFGKMASTLSGQQIETSFDKGVKRFTWMMIIFMAVMVPLVFLINGLTKGNWGEAFFFALAVAVGLTPEMLPMIVSVSLSSGALLMSRKKVIVKRLNSIQNFGAMDILCTDKTGTLTIDHVILEQHCDVVRRENEEVLLYAYLISHFQTGLKSVLDRAILDHREEIHQQKGVERYQKVDEIPFDFMRRMMSVVVQTPDDKHRLLSKGAPEEVFRRCTKFEIDGEILPIEPILVVDLQEEYRRLSADGFRVLALAYKDVDRRNSYSKDDEQDLILKGYVAFLDPPKGSARPAITALQTHGVTVKILTGDNDLVTKKVCHEVGLPTERILTGTEIQKMSDAQLCSEIETTNIFARLTPSDKQRIVQLLRAKGHVVGFLGDGINDAPALRAADVGISVDSAVDIAKESADIILLEKSLMVLEEGVLEGRKVFSNIIKYIRMGASSNFGNMFSVLGASAFLPFLPMTPIQILTNNLLYDFSQVPIPTDNVDREQIAKPRPWSIEEIAKFILFIGPISSIFDYITYFVMLYVFQCWDPSRASLFQTGWFVESLMTQTLIIHIIRTNKIPFIQSMPSVPLVLTSIIIIGIGIVLPYSALASSLGFTPLPPLYWPILLLIISCYLFLTQSVKTILLRKKWI
ncbi:MAG: magnesium-translocating P-type ATPase [Verrucomicrobiia bacterium]